MIRPIFLLLLVALAPATALAQPQMRTLDVPQNATWQHAATGLRLPATVAGATRADIRDTTTEELDVIAAYGARPEGLVVTVYLYRTSFPDTAVWFDRALASMRLRPNSLIPANADPVIESFTAPQAQRPTGLVTAIDLGPGQYRSTALVVVPVADNWLLKVRVTSTQLTRDQLRARLDAFVRALGWPADQANAVEPVPVQPCAQPLRLQRAQVVEQDASESVMAALLAGVAGSRADRQTRFCREPNPTLATGVYRPVDSQDSYVIALGDAGLGLFLEPGMSLDTDRRQIGPSGSGRVTMQLRHRSGTAVWPSFDRLPPPEQAFELFRSRGPVMSAGLRGDRNQAPAPTRK